MLIIGGGERGANIADRQLSQDEFRMVFRSSQYQITFVEKDADRCEELGSLYSVPVFHGDGTRQEVLEQTEPDKIDVPDQCVVAAVLRNEEFVVPRGDTEILVGDHVILVGPREDVKAAQDLFSGVPDRTRP